MKINIGMIVNLDEIDLSKPELVGGKAFSLGHLIKNLKSKNIQVPNGFVLTTDFFKKFIEYNNISKYIEKILEEIDISNLKQLKEKSQKIRELFYSSQFSMEDQIKIFQFYQNLSKSYGQYDIDVSVRSSAVGEDGTNHSWAGQLDTFLNIKGNFNLLTSIKKCFASLYTERLIIYRKTIKDIPHDILKMAVIVQKMVRSDLGSSGVAFSLDTETGFRDVIVINGSYGLGEMVVQGCIEPDEFIVHKPTLIKNFKPIIDKKLGKKNTKMVYNERPLNGTKIVDTDSHEKNIFCLNDDYIIELAKWTIEIETYYSQINNKNIPVDIEWALEKCYSPISKKYEPKLYIVQARPETIHSNLNKNIITEYEIVNHNNSNIIIKGIAVGNKISSGKIKIISSLDSDIAENFNNGDILVVDQTTPDWEPLMIKSSAIICNKGGRTCHAAIIARECGITAIVGTSNGTEILQNDQLVTVSCAEGEIGYVYDGIINYKEKCIDLNNLPKIKTKIMLNIANPNDVFKYAYYPTNGVGLVREEFIINNYIQAHPNALIYYDKILHDQILADKIKNLIVGYENPEIYYVNKLTYGLARIAATFYPNDVIVRFSDFKSNEYGNLLGGQYFESLNEQNPMIGFRGASRYYDDKFKKAFGLECLAIKKIRDEMGLTNVITMIPFCRTPDECVKVLKTMEEFGLKRGSNGLQVYIMCEIPSNVILANEFCELVDGFSIGSNDLTQLVLGLDRDSELVSHIYDEKNPAVKKMISKAIKICKKNNTKIGICGQAPSDYPQFAQFLVEENIDSISVTPDALFRTVNIISKIEIQ